MVDNSRRHRIYLKLCSVLFFAFTTLTFAEDNCNYLCSTVIDFQNRVTLFVGLSGGYARLKNAHEGTGQSGLYRVNLGSFLNLAKSIKLGSELGFQNGVQMLLTDNSTSILGENFLPVTLFAATPVDFLIHVRIEPYKMFYLTFKGGGVHENISVNGAYVKTSYAWLPEMQIGTGISLFSKNRISINYQKFFGRYPKLTNLNLETGETLLNGAPSMQAFLFTVEMNL